MRRAALALSVACAASILAAPGGAAQESPSSEQIRERFPETTARPLFRADRRPPAPPVAATAPEPAAEPAPLQMVSARPSVTLTTFELKGVVIAGGRRVALLHHRGSGATWRLGLGPHETDAADGPALAFDVVEILPDRVTVDGGEPITLPLRRRGASPAETGREMPPATSPSGGERVAGVRAEPVEDYRAPLTPGPMTDLTPRTVFLMASDERGRVAAPSPSASPR